MRSEFDHVLWQQRELERALLAMQPALATWPTIPQSLLDSYASLDRLRDQFSLPREYLEATSRIVASFTSRSIMESLGDLTGTLGKALETFRQQQSQIEELARRFATPVFDPALTLRPLLDSFASTEALFRLGHIDESWLHVALLPQAAFQSFAVGHLGLAETGRDTLGRNQLALVESAAHLLPSITKGFDLAALMRPPSELLWTGPSREVNVYRALDEEVAPRDLEQPEINTAFVVTESRAGSIARLGARLVQLVYNLNIGSEREGQPPIFKPTTSALMACALIPSRVACDASSFAEIIDQLFFLLYEGSGAAARLTSDEAPERLEALWRLKHLRVGVRHDINHGPESDVTRKNRQVGEAYVALIGRVAPRGKEDWTVAQLVLYKQLVEMLERVWLGENK